MRECRGIVDWVGVAATAGEAHGAARHSSGDIRMADTLFSSRTGMRVHQSSV